MLLLLFSLFLQRILSDASKIVKWGYCNSNTGESLRYEGNYQLCSPRSDLYIYLENTVSGLKKKNVLAYPNNLYCSRVLLLRSEYDLNLIYFCCSVAKLYLTLL